MANNKPVKPIKQPVPPWVYGVSAFLLILFCIGTLLIFRPKGMDKAVLFIVYVLISLAACAFLFGFMHSFARQTSEKQKQTKTRKKKIYKELAGPVVLFLILFGFGLNWISGIDDTEPFNFTIFLEDTNGATVLKNEGELTLTLGNEKKSRKINEEGGADFKGISHTFANNSVDVELMADGWQFENGATSTKCQLKGASAKLTVQENYCCISGKIVDEGGNPVIGATVTIKNTSSQTNANGRFELIIPPDQQEEDQILYVRRSGYKEESFTVKPRAKAETTLTLTNSE